MNTLSDIQQELKDLQSPLLQLITNNNVYRLPEGYFEEFPVKILGVLQMNASETDIPAGYFEDFSTKMLARIKEEAEDEVISVDEEFASLAPSIGVISRENVYSLPEGYFANFSDKVLASIKEDSDDEVSQELLSLPPVLAEISKENVFTVPEGYFEKNLEKLKTIATKPQAKVVQMGRIPAVVRYMVAAAFAGLLGLSIFNLVSTNDDAAEHAPIVMAEAQKLLEANSLDAAFENISEGEIEDYLVSNGHDVNAAIAASSINNEDLPSPLDYLIDENTLADYLKLDKQIN